MRESEGLDLSNIGDLTESERDAHLTQLWRHRQPLYSMTAASLMLDYAPDFAKLHRWGADLFGRPDPENITVLAVQNMHSYMMMGWETGILNTFHTLTRAGMNKQQLMEIIMFCQLFSGVRGLGHVYRAVGDMLPLMLEAPGSAPFPEGWDVDPDAFKCGLDLATQEMTAHDAANLCGWYERVIGFVPRSIELGLRIHPEFVKVYRAKWEVAIKTLPKQVAPYIMLRHHTITGLQDGLREAVALGKAWGIDAERLSRGITGSAFYFTGIDGLYTAADAVADLL